MVVELVSGAINWDTTVFVDEFPEPGEEVKARKVTSVPGGKGANAAVASAKILGSDMVGIIGALGSDEIAEKQIKILHGAGVNTRCIKHIDNASSGQAYILVDSNGENIILTYKAANHMITASMVSDDVTLNAMKETKMVTVMDPPLEAARSLISNAKTLGRTVVWAPALLVREGFESLKESLLKTDYLIMNESETSILVNDGDTAGACSKLVGKTHCKVITTLGGAGCLFCSEKRITSIPSMDLAAFGLKVVNTVGAGDAFTGTFSALKAKDFDDLEALFMANISGALKTTKEETRGSPTFEELTRYFQDQRSQAAFSKIRSA